jgi:hypothetical protein
MKRACNKTGGEEKYIWVIGWKVKRKDTTRKNKILMGV